VAKGSIDTAPATNASQYMTPQQQQFAQQNQNTGYSNMIQDNPPPYPGAQSGGMQSPAPSSGSNSGNSGNSGAWSGIDPRLVQIYQSHGIMNPGARGAGFTDAAYWNDVGPSQYNRLAADLEGRGTDAPGPGDQGNTSGGGNYSGGNYSGGSSGFGGDLGSLISQMMGMFQNNQYQNQQPQYQNQPQSAPQYNPNYQGPNKGYVTNYAPGYTQNQNPNAPPGTNIATSAASGIQPSYYTTYGGGSTFGIPGVTLPNQPSKLVWDTGNRNQGSYLMSQLNPTNPYGGGSPYGQSNQPGSSGGGNWGGGIQPWGSSSPFSQNRNTMSSPGPTSFGQ
jgi:hypothetical protein